MPAINVIIDGRGAFRDLDAKRAQGKVIHLAENADITITGLPGGMQSGRASVMIRINLPDGRTVLAESSLRALYAATLALVAKHGEDFMQAREKPADLELKMMIVNKHLLAQLLEAKQRLGEPAELDLTAADAEYEQLKGKSP